MLSSIFPDILSPAFAALILGALLGLAFGVLAQRSRFCLRRALIGEGDDRAAARATWAAALAVSIAGTALLITSGLVDFSKHRFFAGGLPIVAIVAGGLLFGAGTVLARGCASRLTVLSGSGNLRALTTVLVLAIIAHATLKGTLSPVRVWLGSFTIDLGGVTSFSAVPGGTVLWSAVLAAALALVAWRSATRWSPLVMGGLIGTLAPLGWLGTGYLLADEFNPIALESLAFTSAFTDSLFWTIASTAIAPGFGVGFLAGVVGGSLLASLAAREFAVEGFSEETPVGRYMAGGALMGFGGVLAGGCTIGAGLAGAATLSFAAILALGAIGTGIIATAALTRRQTAALQLGYAGQ